MKPKNFAILVISLAVIAGGLFWLGSRSRGTEDPTVGSAAVTIVDGRQVIDITAKGGYTPRKVMAQAGLPTTLRVSTNGSYDCSTSLVIPQLNYNKYLQPTGVEEIPITAEQAKGKLRGLCSMGMYSSEIAFISSS